MPDVRELYQEVILDHQRKPRNFRALEGAVRKIEGFNPLCGDTITVYLQMEEDRIKDMSFQGSGCAISQASASIMTTVLKGKTKAEAESLFEQFHTLITGTRDSSRNGADLGKLEVFSGVSEFPVRVKCASLPWHTMRAALKGSERSVTTE